MIRAGFNTRVYYVSIDGFDTHSDQARTHAGLLETIDTAVTSFFETLADGDFGKRVVLMTFSEFGRRVAENGSQGTDHGSGSSLFVAGPAVKGGLFGKYPSLAKDDLLDGDLKFNVDFRSVYATVLERWLQCDSRIVLGDDFAKLPLI
ncbi:MAG: DUF1501 domain-containing protein [Planctomycetota bacterium]|nr:DUF1501 domain-containing protein [Planctomycetota bacterium]